MRNNKRLLQGSALATQLGDSVFEFALKWWVVSLTSSATVLAIILSIETAVSVVANLLGGVFSDSRNKKKILIITDLISGIGCVVLWFFVVETKVNILLLSFINIVLAITYSIYSPTIKSIVANIIAKEEIGKLNSVLNGISEVVKIMGPIIGVLVIEAVGIKGAILINSASFFLSAILQVFLTYSYTPKHSGGRSVREQLQEIKDDMVSGMQYVIRKKEVFQVLVLASAVNFFLAGYMLLLPFYTKEVFAGSEVYAQALLAQSFGGILAAFVIHRFSVRSSLNTMVIFLFFAGMSLVPVAFLTSQVLLLVVTFSYGACMAFFNINFITYIQLNSDQEYLGRVFSIIFTFAILFMPLGNLFFGWMYEYLSVLSLSISGVAIAMISALYFLRVANKGKHSEESMQS